MDKIMRAHYDNFLPWSMPTRLQFTQLIGQATSLANTQMRFRHTLAPLAHRVLIGSLLPSSLRAWRTSRLGWYVHTS